MTEPTLYIEKGPRTYFIIDSPVPLRGRVLGQTFTLRGARRKALRLLRRGVSLQHTYEVVEEVTRA